MPSIKSDIYITVKSGKRQFSIGGVKMLDGRYKIKRGRSWSERRPFATLTEIFTEARKWSVRNA